MLPWEGGRDAIGPVCPRFGLHLRDAVAPGLTEAQESDLLSRTEDLFGSNLTPSHMTTGL